jgi:uncharacterized iron-regulated membrane protein
MQHAHHPGRWVAALALAALSVSACAKTGGEEDLGNRGATLDSVPGSETGAVTLTDVAEQRIDLKTVAIEQAADGMQIPYAALLYDPEGKTWTFVKIDDHTFQRQAVTVDHITGDTAFLTDGPKAGSEVVVIGAAELYGVEEGVGDVE